MARDEHEAEKVVADVVIERRLNRGLWRFLFLIHLTPDLGVLWDLEHLLAFYELNVTPEYRLGLYKNRKETLVTRTRRKEFTHEFIVSYMLWSGGGFVGYREEKSAPASR